MSKAPAKAQRRSPQGARPNGVSFAEVVAEGLRLPGVEEGVCYGTPCLRLQGKFLLRLKEDGESVAIKIPMDDRDALLQADPAVFHITDHYRGYPAVLFRLAAIRAEQLADLLELAWRFVAPKRLVAAFDASNT